MKLISFGKQLLTRQIWLAMKLTVILMTAAFLQVSASGNSQTVNFSGKEVSLKRVFTVIKSQTGNVFFYDVALLREAKPVTVDLKNVPLETALNEIFKDQTLTWLMENKTITIIKKPVKITETTVPVISEPPPPIPIKGTVTDQDGKGIPDVSVLVKGTQKGTTTDNNGNFSIDADKGQVLVFSSVGYVTKELKVEGSEINIKLVVENIQLTDVVVGYGTQKKNEITGAVANVDLKKATIKPTTDVAEMLRGRAAGVQITAINLRPGGTSSILIRGKKSISGSNDPLIVLDGFPIENINDVMPDDIASIDILKDASSQAIYGARASNGVILITTKKGKQGKMKIEFNSYLTKQSLLTSFKLFSPEEFVQLRREAVRSKQPAANQFKPDGSPLYQSDIINFGGSVNAPEYQNFIRPNGYTNWNDVLFPGGFVSNNTLSVSGGNENTKVYASINYFDQTGLVHDAEYKRGAFRLNLDQKINKKINLEANINISKDVQPKEGSTISLHISPFANPYDSTGKLILNLPGGSGINVFNPLWINRETDNEVKANFYNLNIAGNYKITKNFTYRLNTLFSTRKIEEGIYWTRLNPGGSAVNGQATINGTSKDEYLIENILNYKGQLSNNHKFENTFVQSVNNRNSAITRSTGTGFPNDFLSYHGMSNALNYTATRQEDRYRLVSFMNRLRYTFMDRYLFTFTARKDGASVFSKNNKWGFFPAGAFAWQIDKESFMKNIKSIDQLKLRIGYGSVGNQSIAPYQTLGTVANSFYIFNGVLSSGFLPGTSLYNPNLSWETSTTFNVGVDYGFFKNRITGAIDYYNARTTDLLTNISLGGGAGYTSTITNGGESMNKGIEVLLTGNIIRTKDLDFSVTATYTQNKNEFIKTGRVDANGKPTDDLVSSRFIGQSFSTIRAYAFNGIFQTDAEALASPQANPASITNSLAKLKAGTVILKDINGDGIINDIDRVFINQDPKWYGSLSLNLNYKGFEFLADFYTLQGATKFNGSPSFTSTYTTSNNNGFKVDYWTPENHSNTYPRPQYGPPGFVENTGVLGLGYQDGSFVKFQTLSLAYNFQEALLKKIKLSQFRVFVAINNLHTWTKYLSYNPDVSLTANTFPDSRSLTLGLKVGF